MVRRNISIAPLNPLCDHIHDVQDCQTNFGQQHLFIAVYLKNRKLQNALGCMPYKAWTGNDKDVSHLQVFGAFAKARKSGNKSSRANPAWLC
jgi:hypothetical protein